MRKIRLAFVGHHGHFVGNCKYLFLSSLKDDRFSSTYITSRADTFNDLSRNGLPVKTIDDALIDDFSLADFIVLDDGVTEDIKARFGTRPLVQLWHGIGPKMAGLAQISAGHIDLPTWHENLINTIYTGYNMVCSTSQLGQFLFKNYFDAIEFPIVGMCRNDVLFRNNTEHDLIGSADINVAKNKLTTLFAPTFREHGSAMHDFLGADLPSILGHEGIELIVKPHPYDRAGSDLRKISTVIDPLLDIYPILKDIDLLITDYSSLASDFSLLDKPIIHFAPDRDVYERTCRDMSYDPEIFKLGPWVSDAKTLIKEIMKIRDNGDEYVQQRRSASALLHDVRDGSACTRTLDQIARRSDFAEPGKGVEPKAVSWQKRRPDRSNTGRKIDVTAMGDIKGPANYELCLAVQNSDYKSAREKFAIINGIESIDCCVIGDSHVWGYAAPSILPIWTGPITMHRFGRDGGDVCKISEFNLDRERMKLIFNFGEIDARSHVGAQAARQGKSQFEICDVLVRRYIAAIHNITRGWPAEAIWIATTVPPHEIPPDSPHAFVNAPPLLERIESSRILNACLMRHVANSPYKLLDAYNLLAGLDGSLSPGLTNDDIHIYTEKGQSLLRSCCEKTLDLNYSKDWRTAQRWTIDGRPISVAQMLEAERRYRTLTPDEEHYLGRALLDLGQAPEAVSLLESARHYCSEMPWASFYLAKALRAAGRGRDAASLLDDLASQQSSHAYLMSLVSEERTLLSNERGTD